MRCKNAKSCLIQVGDGHKPARKINRLCVILMSPWGSA